MSKLYKLSEDAIKTFNDVFKKKSFSIDIKFEFIGSESQKSLIKISKIPDQFSFAFEKEILVTINEDILSVLDDESIQILIEQEIDKVFVSIDTGKIKLVKPDLTTFSALISKYGIDKISKANNIQLLVSDQNDDSGFIV